MFGTIATLCVDATKFMFAEEKHIEDRLVLI